MSSLTKKYYDIEQPASTLKNSTKSSGLAVITTGTEFSVPQETESVAFPTVKALSASESEAVTFA